MSSSISVVCIMVASLLIGGEDEERPEKQSTSEGMSLDAVDLTRPTLKEIFQPPHTLGQRPRIAGISADGKYVTYWWAEKDSEKPERDLWLVSTAGGDAKRLFQAKEDAEVYWTHSGAKLIVIRDGWIETMDVGDADETLPIIEVGGKHSRPKILKNGQQIAIVAGENSQLWLVNLENHQRTTPAEHLNNRSRWFQEAEEARLLAILADRTEPARASKDDGDQNSNNESKETEKETRVVHLIPIDEEDISTETTLEEGGRLLVSSDGRFIARSTTEREPMRDLIMADYLTETVTTVPVRSSLPGDRAPGVDVEIYDVALSESFAPPLDEGSHYWFSNLSWSPTGSLLLVHRLSNDFHVRQILIVDPTTRSSRLLFTERDESWIGGPLTFASWDMKGEAVLYTSEQSGFNHLYRHSLDSDEATCLTDDSRSFEIHSVRLLENGTQALILSNEPDPAVRAIFLLDLDSGTARRLSSAEGCASGILASRNGTRAVFNQEFLGQPSEIFSAELAEGASPVPLTMTQTDAFKELDLPLPEIVEYENPSDGTVVRAFLYRPQPLDPDRVYPAVVFVHGAGYLQNVLNSMSSYDVNMLFHQRLARLGYVVLDPDYRHSKGYGREFRTAIYGHMGGKDLDDVVAGATYLADQPWVDENRIGIYGGSYGGFMTLMALFTRPEVFACGAALRSVSDWRTYSAWYTNPRLGDPEKDRENYRRSSPIDHAEGLEKPLLILHGLKDSNVFAQDSIRLIEKLIELEKEFDAMLYPSQGHGFTDPQSWLDEYRRIEDLFDEHLEPAKDFAPESGFVPEIDQAGSG